MSLGCEPMLSSLLAAQALLNENTYATEVSYPHPHPTGSSHLTHYLLMSTPFTAMERKKKRMVSKVSKSVGSNTRAMPKDRNKCPS